MVLEKKSKIQIPHRLHWETAVFDNDIWRYLEGTYEPDTNWRQITFDDSSWLQGEGGVGYGDGDDSTIISSVTSLYLRKSFNIILCS